MMLLSSLLMTLFAPAAAQAASGDSFHESLTLHPLPDGKLSVLFEFTTYFSASSKPGRISQSHHSLTPPALLLPLERHNVSELTLSFVAGQWDQRRSGEAGPLSYDTGGGGGEIRGWLRDSGDDKRNAEAWTGLTHAFGGLFCAALGEGGQGETVRTFGDIYPPQRASDNLTHFHLPKPETHLCTENLTPFLSLLPSKGFSGLSHLLAQPRTVFAWGFKAEGIEVVMPVPAALSPDGRLLPGRWRGWWEGVVDLIPDGKPTSGVRQRQLSLEKVFGRGIPKAFPEATESVLRFVTPSDGHQGMTIRPDGSHSRAWRDGKVRDVVEWDLSAPDLEGKDISFVWDHEQEFHYPRSLPSPPVTISRTVTSPVASDGTFTIRIRNNADSARSAVYSEAWPWWVKGWMSEMRVRLDGSLDVRNDLISSFSYCPSKPPTVSTTSLHLHLTLPANSTIVLDIPFSKLTLKYTEHRPDAERGMEIPSGVLTLLDLLDEGEAIRDAAVIRPTNAADPRRSGRRHIYTSRLLLDVPTPDFSMPYNVIIMSCTVMAIFFGMMHGALTRRWSFVELEAEPHMKNGDPTGVDALQPADAHAKRSR